MKLQNPKGYTLTELIVAIALIGVVTVLVGNFFMNNLTLWKMAREQEEAQFKARTALRTVTSEIREMQDAENGAFAIASAGATEFIFFADVDSDPDVERVRYFHNANELQRGVIDPTGSPATYPLMSEIINTEVTDVYLSGDLFSYYDELYTGSEPALATPFDTGDVHLIKIYFLVDTNPGEIPEAMEITTEVTPRNLKQYAPAP